MNWIATILLLGGWCGKAAIAETAVSDAYHHPLQVELVNYIDVHRSHAGSSVFVKVVNDWAGLGCFFRNGQILEARVEVATSRGNRTSKAASMEFGAGAGKGSRLSQLAVSFNRVPCLYNQQSINLVLAAVLWDPNAAIPNSSFPIIHNSMVKTGSVPTIQGSYIVDGLEMLSLKAKPGMGKPLKPEDVVGIRGVTLRMGAGPSRCSILESSTTDVALERDTAFVLVPETVAFAHPSSTSLNREVDLSEGKSAAPVADSGAGTPGAAAAKAIVPAPPREFLACEPPACTVDLPSADQRHVGNAAAAFAIRQLGYAPRPQRELEELVEDDAVAWLGDHQLMVAFNPHKLIPRDGVTTNGATVRRIHAVVLDLASQKVTGTADWDLADRGAYLWQLSDQRVLVHAGDELRVLGEDMQVEKRIPLDGPLAFVRTSPSGEVMAIAVTHERHTAEMHSRLREALGHEPEEDVEIRILDKNFETVAQANSSGGIMPPILLNEGQVRLLASPEMKYRLEMLPWQGDSVTVARFTSACLPSVSSFAPDLLFVATCAPQTRIHEYRVLRPNGAVVMRGKSDPQSIGQEVFGTDGKFAVKVIHARHAVVDGSVFRGEDLDYAEVRIHRSEDGKSISAIRIATPPPSRGGFALSPDGSQLAVLSEAQLSVYALQ